jgi:hypothetical protein
MSTASCVTAAALDLAMSVGSRRTPTGATVIAGHSTMIEGPELCGARCQLANATGLTKSGLYAHFGSKKEPQLATIETARVLFVDDLIRRGLAVPRGICRLLATCDAFLSHVERKVFPGGHFSNGLLPPGLG